jgi:3,4-dihydroxy-2-butanone 4-phosphate synthase
MPRYLSLHTLACLTRQGAEELAARLAAASGVTARRVLVNMVEGKMLVEFEAADRSALERWFQEQGFHYDWILRVEFESEGGRLVPSA